MSARPDPDQFAPDASEPSKWTRDRKRKAAAERQRRKRERRRDGKMVVTVEVPRHARDVLVEARWIGEWSEDNPDAVAEAVQILINGLRTVTRDGSD